MTAKELFTSLGIERSSQYITSNVHNIIRVRVPDQPSRTFNPKFFKSLKIMVIQAIEYRDSMLRKNRTYKKKEPLFDILVPELFKKYKIRINPSGIYTTTTNEDDINALVLKFYLDGISLLYKIEFDELKEGAESKLYYAAYFIARLRNIIYRTKKPPTPANIKNARRWAYATSKHELQNLTDEEYIEHATKFNKESQ
jgi:hypothetical protein